ncbi:MAG: HEAT repeat domain-containing protein [Prochlorococcaceae cyanobacterium]
MGPSIVAGAAALLLVLTWSLRRRSPPALLRSTDASAIAALNRAQIALLGSGPSRDTAGPAGGTAASPGAPAATLEAAVDGAIPPPGDARRRAQLRARLELQLRGDGQQRLQAMGIARRWGRREALPVLRRGLRDVDPRVVQEAALGLDRFRRCPLAAASAGPQRPLPPNVSRTR